jgi:hypothetical protein
MEKYYTPDIEEFHVGFEYEMYDPYDGSWNPSKMTTKSNLEFYRDVIEDIRVKYLDKEDIESLGWKYIKDSSLNKKRHQYYFYLDNFILITLGGSILIKHSKSFSVPWGTEIHLQAIVDFADIRFYGTTKNKSELKRLMKQLGIWDGA